MRKSNRWQVQLGEENWARYTYARPADAGLRLLGSVSRGAQVGALAETAEGRFVQVNGDHVTALSDSQVRRAIGTVRQAPPLREQALRSSSVVVTIKKRRVVGSADQRSSKGLSAG